MKTPLIFLSTCLFCSTTNAAANFDISPTPGTTLPTKVPLGSQVSASYTITNLTQSTRSGYRITGLPSTASQNTDAGNCPKSIKLGAKESCILILDIAGEASSNFALCHGATCTSASVPLNVRVTNALSGLPSIAVGQYDDESGVLKPMLALSNGNISTWIYPSEVSNPQLSPALSSRGRLIGGDCLDSTCIAVGRYDSSNIDGIPMLALTKDSGNSWTFPTAITIPNTSPEFRDNGRLEGASCSGNTCIASGSYVAIDSVQRPLLALSTNLGSTWTFPEAVTEPTTISPAFSGRGQLFKASCYDSTCISSGLYQDINGVLRSLVSLTTDGGATWTFPADITNFTIANLSSSSLAGAECTDLACLASGTYVDTSAIQRPLLAVSVDNGSSWTFPTDITNPTTTPPLVGRGTLYSVSCSGTLCIAVGRYHDSNDDRRPLLGVSNDTGSTWTFPESITNPTTLPDFASGSLFSASCSDAICIASGEYFDSSSNRYPLIAQSTDRGITWTYVSEVITPDTTPPYSASGILFGASCSGNSCIASGYYEDGSGLVRPLLAVTDNAGSSWTFPDSITEADGLPAFQSAVFNDAGVQN